MKIEVIPDNNTHLHKVILKSTIEGIKETPHCIDHGAMLKVAVFEGGAYWRCCTVDGVTCRAGCMEVIS